MADQNQSYPPQASLGQHGGSTPPPPPGGSSAYPSAQQYRPAPQATPAPQPSAAPPPAPGTGYATAGNTGYGAPGYGGSGYGQPPYQPAPGPAAPPPRRRGGGLMTALIVVLVLAILGVAGAIGYVLLRPQGKDDPQPAPQPTVAASASPTASPSAAESPSATPSPSKTPSPTPSAPTESEALAKLAAYRDGDVAGLTPHGQWVASLSSKWVGVTDPLQTTQSGSHTFQAVDILREHEVLRKADNKGAGVKLIYGTDFGTQQTHEGATIYVTIADGGWGSREQAQAWCGQRYPGLSGADLDNVCMPLQLTPKR